MKKKILIVSMLAALSTASYSSTWGDMKYIDQLVQNQEYDMAEEELLDFLKKYPDSKKYYPLALDRIAKLYYLEKNYAEARKYFKEYLKDENLKDDERQEGIYNLIRTDIELGDLDEAKKYADFIVSEKKYLAFFQLAKAFYDRENFEEAQLYFRRLLKIDSEYYGEGLLYLSLSSYKGSEYVRSIVFGEEYLSKAKTGDKNLSLVNFILGSAHLKIGDLTIAEKYFKTIEEKHSGSEYADDSKYQLLKLYVEKRREKEAQTYLEKLKGSKYEEDGYQEIAQYYLFKGDYPRAEKYYGAIAYKSGKPETIYGYAQSLLKQDKNSQALVQFKKLKDSDYDSEYYYYTSYILYGEKRYKEVLAILENFENKGIKEEYLKNIGVFFATSSYETGKYKVAKKYFQKIYSEDPNKENLYNMMLVNSKLEDLDSLEKNFSKYKKEYPDDIKYKKSTYLIMGNTYFAVGQLEKAEKFYETSLGENFDQETLGNLIMVLAKEGKYSKLLSYLEKAEPSVENVYLKGTAHLGLNQYQQAETSLLWVMNSKEAMEDQRERANFRLIKNYLSWKKYDKAIEYSEKYEKNYNKYRYEALDMRAVAYFKLGAYKNSRLVYEKFAEDAKWAEYGKFQTAETYYNEGNYAQAKKHYEELASKNGKYAEDSLYWVISIDYYERDYKGALEGIAQFKKKYQQSKYSQDISYITGEIYLAKNEKAKAVSEYENLYEKTKDFSTGEKSAEKLVETYYDMGEYEKSLQWASKLKDGKKTVLWRAAVYMKTGKVNDALKEYNKVIEDENYGDRANFALGDHYLEEGETEKALSHYERAAEFEKSLLKDKALFKVGEVQLKKENYMDSLKAFTRIRVLYDKSELREAAMIRIAKIYEIQNEEDKSLKTYLELYDNYKTSKNYPYFIKKILVQYLKLEKVEIAKNYYVELRKLDVKEAEPFKKYFKN
jgi:tetratricopeptide (TPR) repeat protein